jgi:hypothetical protein
MVTNTLQRDYDIARIIDDYERRISYLERQTLKLQPLITDTGWVAVPAAAGFTSTLEVRRQGNEVMYRGTLLPNVDWGAANSAQQPVAAGGVPAEFRPPASLIYIGGSGAGSAANLFRIAIQSNGGIQVRCNTAAHTNSCSVNTDLLND